MMNDQSASTQNASFRNSMPTVTAGGKRNWIYARKPVGRLYTLRSVLSWLYILLFFSLPLVQIKGNPAIQFNIPEGRFFILGQVFWPQDFFIFGMVMVAFIVFVVLFTMIYGRVFCGWACPQTIFMEMLFRKIEWWIEGNPNQQRTLNNGPWNRAKILKKTAKHVAFFLLSFLIANTFLAYIIGVKELAAIVKEPPYMHIGGLAAMLFFTAVFYVVYAYVREIVCTVICPYGRLQGVLLDKDSVVVAYDYNRGEPRVKGKRNTNQQAGDCIDCFQCVTVCPTGIDIRNGVQMECVNCTACIDACNHVMDKIGLPQGLIRFASENQLSQKKPFRFTSRMKLYSVLLLLLIGVISTALLTRSAVDVKVMRARGQLFQEVGADSLSNLYNVIMVNKTHETVPVVLKIKDDAASIRFVGQHHMQVPGEAQGEAAFFIVMNKKQIKSRETLLQLEVYLNNKKIKTISTSFLGYVE